ncbi:hypothetical protein ACO1O0_005725 [Amphichorda felina]
MGLEAPPSRGSGSPPPSAGESTMISGEDASRDIEKTAIAQDGEASNAANAEVSSGPGTDNNENSGDDPNIVWWDGENDPENPYNWPTWMKFTNCACISALTFVTPLASSIFAPGVPDLMVDFGESSQEMASFVVSVYVLGFAFGPMLIAPLSEIYGRVPVYHVCNICFIGFSVGCAKAPSFAALVVFRFLAGTFGSCPLTNGGGSIADMISQEKRAAAMSAFSIGPLIGPVLGPVAGGALHDAKGWRWVFWVVTIVSGFLSAVMVLTMRESYAPVILQRKVRRLRKETGNDRLRSKMDTGLTPKEMFRRAIVRPMKMLIFSPICTIFALHMVLVYGYLYLLFTSVTFVFKQHYGFTTTQVGLVYLGLGLGSFIGMAWFSVDSNNEIKKNMGTAGEEGVVGGNKAKPEVRLKLLPHGAVFLPVGFFIYGWTTDYHTHWIAPIIGLCVIGIGNLMCLMAVSMYLVDTYSMYAASALAANTIMRSIAGGVLPLCALKMYDKLGLGWGNSLLAFIALAFLPIPFLMQRYGERLRNGFDASRL